MNLNEIRYKAYKIACEHGFHDNELSNEHCLMLVITELSEAIQADRKGRFVTDEDKAEYLKCQKDKFYMYAYENYIEGTVDEELADTVIRILDIAGMRNIDLNDRFVISYTVSRNKSFTENCYSIIKDIVNYRYTLEENINYSIRQVIELAGFYNINLEWHIKMKMEYNSLRENKHGKKY